MPNFNKKQTIKNYFQPGDIPTAEQFSEFINLATNASSLDAGTIAEQYLPQDLSLNSFTGDGSALTGISISADAIVSGTVHPERLPQDLSVNSISGDGSGLTGIEIDAGNITSGTISGDRLPQDLIVNSIGGDGSGLTGITINADNISGGTLDPSVLPVDFNTIPDFSETIPKLVIENAYVNQGLELGTNNSGSGTLKVQGSSYLHNVSVSQVLEVENKFDIWSDHFTLNARAQGMPTNDAIIKHHRGDQGPLDILTFNEVEGVMTIPVKISDNFSQQEIASKNWVSNEITRTNENNKNQYFSKFGGLMEGSLNVQGTISASGDITAFSDERLKTDIEVIHDPIERIKNIRGVTFLRNDLNTDQRFTGVIAQEVQAVLPEAVAHKDGTLSVAYGNMVGLLVEGIKSLQSEVDDLKKQVISLSGLYNDV